MQTLHVPLATLWFHAPLDRDEGFHLPVHHGSTENGNLFCNPLLKTLKLFLFHILKLWVNNSRSHIALTHQLLDLQLPRLDSLSAFCFGLLGKLEGLLEIVLLRNNRSLIYNRRLLHL